MAPARLSSSGEIPTEPAIGLRADATLVRQPVGMVDDGRVPDLQSPGQLRGPQTRLGLDLAQERGGRPMQPRDARAAWKRPVHAPPRVVSDDTTGALQDGQVVDGRPP